ncbi:MAG: elongation factor G [Candidatus Dojkabacteria bacterium]|nr:elongation factor G [Candidatus Dojkabacteria bacterium]
MAKGENVKFDLNKVRNIGIIAHIDAGKTTTTEAVLYHTGKTHRIGSIDEGDTQMDWMVQERERGITIQSAATTAFWKLDDVTYRVNIIDTPGHVDFTAEVERSLRVLDGAVVIFDGKMGVEPQSETVWRQADKYQVPRICFVNKLNLVGASFDEALTSIRERLSPRAFPVHLPLGFEKGTNGLVDIVERKAFTYDPTVKDEELTEVEIPQDLKDKIEKLRVELIEAIADFDDTFMEKYLNGEDLSNEEIWETMRKATMSGTFFPVSGGDSKKGNVVPKILDLVVRLLPSPIDRGEIVAHDAKDTEKEVIIHASEDEPFAGLVFKLSTDPHIGNLAYLRVYSGVLRAGTYVLNVVRGTKERVGRVVLMHANHREEVEEIRAGDIAALVGLKISKTGDTLCDENRQVLLEQIDFPDPVVNVAIEPKSKADQEKMGVALGRLSDEDPTFRISVNEETGQTIISGMGELHLEIIVDRMRREFNVEANVGRPQVAYKETVQRIAEGEGKYIHQSGGHGQYGHCRIRIEPKEPGEGFEFKDEVKGGAIPKEFIPAIQKGVKEAMLSGVVAGYPVVDVRVAVYDGSYHEVDSSESAFKIAGATAFKSASTHADPVLLEPIMDVDVVTPEDFVGDVTGFLSGKRGKIEKTETRGNLHVITAKVPLAELFGFTNQLRSMTSGRGVPNVEFSHYDRVPRNIAQEIIDARTGGTGK